VNVIACGFIKSQSSALCPKTFTLSIVLVLPNPSLFFFLCMHSDRISFHRKKIFENETDMKKQPAHFALHHKLHSPS